ncbi:MAG: hypothetical protein BGO20_09555 [Bosea sp. 67-29]|nr:MAG: hypothetical protein BGO20_09555 [Bosea sp. 67-29]
MMKTLLARFLPTKVRPQDYLWHRYEWIWPPRLLDGRRAQGLGQVWRRRKPDGSGWEFRQDGETPEEFSASQW